MTRSATSDEAARPGQASHSGFRLPRAARLRRAGDVRRVQRLGRRIPGPFVDVIWTPASTERPRVGVIVPRYGRSAVERNRVRRRLLEIARTTWMPTLLARGVGADFLLRAKPTAYGVSYERLRESLSEPLETLCARCS